MEVRARQLARTLERPIWPAVRRSAPWATVPGTKSPLPAAGEGQGEGTRPASPYDLAKTA